MQNAQRNELNWKVRRFCANQFAIVAAFLMLRARLQWDSKSHEGLLELLLSISLFRTAEKIFYLPLLVGLHGSTDTTSRKSSTEEQGVLFWKVTLPSAALIFF